MSEVEEEFTAAEKAFREMTPRQRTQRANEALLEWARGRGAARIAKWERDNQRKWPGWALGKRR